MLALVCGVLAPSPAVAAPAAAAPSAELRLEASSDHLARMRAALGQVRARAAEARREKDAARVECLEDKLAQLRALVSVGEAADVALRESIARKDAASDAELSRIALARRRVEALRAEADACVGQLAYVVEEGTAVEVLAPTDLPGSGPARSSAGIPVAGGAGRLSPFVELEGRHDSNVAFAEGGRRTADVVLHGRAGAGLVLSGGLLALDLAGALGWTEYLGREGDTGGLSTWDGDAHLALGVNRGGAIGLEVEDELRRGLATGALTLGPALIEVSNALRLRVPWRPGGRALALAAVGEWRSARYRPWLDAAACAGRAATCDAELLDDLGHEEVRAGADVRWGFLPRTALVLAGTWLSRRPDDERISDPVSAIEVRAGLEGLVTRRLSATVKVGWADTLGSAAKSVRAWLGELVLTWRHSGGSALHAGYGRALGVEPGAFSVHAADRVKAGGRLVRGRFGARLDASWDRLESEIVEGARASIATVEPALEVAAARWLSASLGYTFSSRSSRPEGAASVAGQAYEKHEAWLKLRLGY